MTSPNYAFKARPNYAFKNIRAPAVAQSFLLYGHDFPSRKTVPAPQSPKSNYFDTPSRGVSIPARIWFCAALLLSAPQTGRLLGVSEQMIYNWERKTTSPRREQMPKIVALRSLGKREAQQRLSELASPTKSAKGAKKIK